jgi:hypothetical protein
MTHGPDLPVPPARALQGWWRDLAPLRPGRLWFGRLLLHQVGALVETTSETVLEPLQRALLRAGTPDSALASFDPQVRAVLVAELADAGLLGANGTGFGPTPAGRAAADAGSFTRVRRERRTFRFVDNSGCGRPPHFLAVQRPPEQAVAPPDWTFPAEALAECVRRPQEWKERHRFSSDVRSVVDLAAAPADWRAVLTDRAEQLLCVVVEAAEGPAVAFAVRSDTWGLERDPPAFTLASGWEDVLPDLAAEPPPEEWRRAWSAWCQPRGVAEADAGACALERQGGQLLVRAPKKLAERLRTARGDPLKNEAWLLAGTGRFRAAAQLSVTE